jgi:hypothetical protein
MNKIKNIITKDEFISYEKVRQSGVTNMFNLELVCDLTGLTRKQCIYIMNNYSNLNKIWPEVRTTEYEKKIGIVNLNGF